MPEISTEQARLIARDYEVGAPDPAHVPEFVAKLYKAVQKNWQSSLLTFLILSADAPERLPGQAANCTFPSSPEVSGVVAPNQLIIEKTKNGDRIVPQGTTLPIRLSVRLDNPPRIAALTQIGEIDDSAGQLIIATSQETPSSPGAAPKTNSANPKVKGVSFSVDAARRLSNYFDALYGKLEACARDHQNGKTRAPSGLAELIPPKPIDPGALSNYISESFATVDIDDNRVIHLRNQGQKENSLVALLCISGLTSVLAVAAFLAHGAYKKYQFAKAVAGTLLNELESDIEPTIEE